MTRQNGTTHCRVEPITAGLPHLACLQGRGEQASGRLCCGADIDKVAQSCGALQVISGLLLRARLAWQCRPALWRIRSDLRGLAGRALQRLHGNPCTRAESAGLLLLLLLLRLRLRLRCFLHLACTAGRGQPAAV